MDNKNDEIINKIDESNIVDMGAFTLVKTLVFLLKMAGFALGIGLIVVLESKQKASIILMILYIAYIVILAFAYCYKLWWKRKNSAAVVYKKNLFLNIKVIYIITTILLSYGIIHILSSGDEKVRFFVTAVCIGLDILVFAVLKECIFINFKMFISAISVSSIFNHAIIYTYFETIYMSFIYFVVTFVVLLIALYAIRFIFSKEYILMELSKWRR